MIKEFEGLKKLKIQEHEKVKGYWALNFKAMKKF